MALTDNNGTQYYAIPTGVASVTPNLSSNNRTSYYWLSSNDFILWGQENQYTQLSDNNGTFYYFYKCNVPSSSGLSLSANNGTKYYYQSAFNCISFEGSVIALQYNGGNLIYNGNLISYNS